MNAPSHGGNIRKLAETAGKPEGEILDFSANINPLGMPDWLRPLTSSSVSSLVHYPDPDCTDLVNAFATRYNVPASEVVVGNGSSELLHALPSVLGRENAIIPTPSYSDYERAALRSKMTITNIPITEANGFRLDFNRLEAAITGDDIIFIGQPNNPTGISCDPSIIRQAALNHPSSMFIIDEAFADFSENMSRMMQQRPPNVVILVSLTKIFAIPGLRLGCAVADPAVAQKLRDWLPTWSVNTFAQAIGAAALRDTAYVANTVAFVKEQRASLMKSLAAIPAFTVYPGEANFLLVKINSGSIDAPALAEKLLASGIAIRVCTNFKGLDEKFLRIAVRTADENARLCNELSKILNGDLSTSLRMTALAPSKRAGVRKKCPAIMFQGTGSNAGKSILTAAFCRILLQDGFRPAPYKSQNMSLNSFVTRAGGEMGRAQVVQAQACRLEPDVRMNPILLKPNSDTGSQVIILGKPVGNMDVEKYINFKPEAWKSATDAYDSLASESDVMVIEGAGSPAEMNLKHHDIVNMKMAAYAGAPVLLVGDIDRGGVYASFVGTMEVLAEWERALVAGFIVNRFRGRRELLADAHSYTKRHTGLPVLGVVPYLHKLGLPEEDSVTFKAQTSSGAAASADCVDIAIIDLPHISNFTDFDAFNLEPDVSIRIVRSAAELGKPDAIILPGSKNVIADIAHLMKGGLAAAINNCAASGKTEIVGVCGGYQMLGKSITDPHAIESAGKSIPGLGLMPVSTVMMPEKVLVRVDARHLDSNLPLTGYEIHHGQTSLEGSKPLVIGNGGEVIGSATADRMIWGTYLHGLFDADAFRRWFIDRLRTRRGLKPAGRIMATYDLEPALDRLAATVRENIDVKEIYRLAGIR